MVAPDKGRVLVVDDEAAIRALVAKIIERAGFAVDTARDGREAIDKLNESEYDVLVIDLMMPNIDGYGVVDFLRERGGPQPAVILVTAADSAAVRKMDGAFVHSVLRKPFDIDVLADLISAAAQTMRREHQQEDGHVLPFPEREVC
ncbi:MAG TPA: response regulator [Thermoanaerobaculia bacterium]|jgi:DNA-binding response OmpR family regulator